jgi:hypothetical protein
MEESLDLTAVEVEGEHSVHSSSLTSVHGSVFGVCSSGTCVIGVKMGMHSSSEKHSDFAKHSVSAECH